VQLEEEYIHRNQLWVDFENAMNELSTFATLAIFGIPRLAKPFSPPTQLNPSSRC